MLQTYLGYAGMNLMPRKYYFTIFQIFLLSYVQTTANCGGYTVSIIDSQFVVVVVVFCFTKDPTESLHTFER